MSLAHQEDVVEHRSSGLSKADPSQWGDERGSLAPLFLMVMVGVIAGMLAFMQMGHASVLSTESNTAADAAALAGAQELASQLRNLDAGVLAEASSVLDRDRICRAAEDYASRNDATLTDCHVRLNPFQVTVTVRGDTGIISGPIEDDPEKRPISRARAEVGVRFASAGGGPGGGGGGGAGSTSRNLSASALDPDLRDADVPELMEILIQFASDIDSERLPYVWGGGHGTHPSVPTRGLAGVGPVGYDCSGAVSALLQQVFPDFPTITSGMFMDIPGTTAGQVSTHGLTIWAYPGHVFVTLGGSGWGTGSGHTPGAGWLTYDTPGAGYHRAATPYTIDALEPRTEAERAAIEALMADLYNGPGSPGAPSGSGSGWGGGSGGVMLPPTVRLVPID